MRSTPLSPRSLLPAPVILAVAAWLGGCASPEPHRPDVVPDTLASCAGAPEVFRPLEGGLAAVGADSTLEVATWNLEFFPLRLPGGYNCSHSPDNGRVEQTANLINLLDLDLIAVQEISRPEGFDQLVDLCPGYAGLLSPEDRGCNYQRPGLIYREDQVTVRDSKLLFSSNTYAFPRSPLQVDLTVAANGRSYDLSLIIVHLKASGDPSSQARRRAASAFLKSYLDDQAIQNPDVDFMIAGDWNDLVEDPLDISSFPDFLTDPDDYQFLSMSLAGQSEFASHPFGGGSLIDHILINRAACSDFTEARVTTLRLDLLLPSYDNISDHRPVLVQAPIFR